MTTPEEAFKKWFSENHPYHDEYDDATGIAEDAWLEATRQAYEHAAKVIDITRAEALLMAGEMTAQEWRTVSAILTSLQSRLKDIK